MADDLKRRRPEDPTRISLAEDWEVKYRCDKLKVSPDELRAGVKANGPSADAVERQLAGNRGK
jgi:hypothetical protein